MLLHDTTRNKKITSKMGWNEYILSQNGKGNMVITDI